MLKTVRFVLMSNVYQFRIFNVLNGIFNGVDKPFTVVGLVSYGVGCGWQGFPGVYTEVRYFLDFIEQARNGTIAPVSYYN